MMDHKSYISPTVNTFTMSGGITDIISELISKKLPNEKIKSHITEISSLSPKLR